MTSYRTLPEDPTCSHGRPYWGCADCLEVFRKLDHDDDEGCWCRPKKTYTDPVTNTEVWVHRYADD